MLAPSRDVLNHMLDVCSEYVEAYDILSNATKTKCTFFITYSTFFLLKLFNVWEVIYVLLINVNV